MILGPLLRRFGLASDSEPEESTEYPCLYCGEDEFLSILERNMHMMDEHPREMNPPTVQEDELESLLDETEADLRSLYGRRERASGVYVLERIRREMIGE